ncbi:MAG: NDP-sugar synthase [Candidatus Aramenus sp.]|nr:NDP-sugar synthase [Candidatus Aramenus sp.]
MVSAIVLAGGYATRLRPLSLTKPKALFPVLGKPIIDYILDSIELAGINDVYLSLRVMAEKVISHLEATGRRATFVVEKEPLGDAGPLKYISSNYKLDETVLVVYGDIYSEIDVRELLKFHEKSGCPATVVGKRVENPRRYGVLVTEGDVLAQIQEKPENPISNLINAGIYVFDKKLFSLIGRDGASEASIAKDFLPKLLDTTCVSVYEYKGVWADIGVPKDYMKLNFNLLAEKYPKGFVSSEAKVSERSTLSPPYYVSPGVSVSDEAVISQNSVIGKGSEIGKGVFLGNSILMDNVKVGDYSYLVGTIIADKSRIGKWNHLREDTIVGEEVLTRDGVLLNRETIILPNKEVTEPIYERGKIIL